MELCIILLVSDNKCLYSEIIFNLHYWSVRQSAWEGGFPCCHYYNGWNFTDDFGLKSRRMKLIFNKHEKYKSEFSTRLNALHMKIIPKTSFGIFNALIVSNLLKIWRPIMLAHIHWKPELYTKASVLYFSV